MTNDDFNLSRRIGLLILFIGFILPINTINKKSKHFITYIEILLNKICLYGDFKIYLVELIILFILAIILILHGFKNKNEVGLLRGGLIFLLFGLITINSPGGLLIVAGSLLISLISFVKLFFPDLFEGFTSD